MKFRKLPTQNRIKELLDYNQETGHFTCIKDIGRRKAGQRIGAINGNGYVQILLDGHIYKAHRLAFVYMTGQDPKDQIDHKNGCRSDNSWSNLRECTGLENRQNQQKPSHGKTSKHIGVSYEKRDNAWIATVQINKKQYHKYCKSEEEALQWRIEMKKTLHPFQKIDRSLLGNGEM